MRRIALTDKELRAAAWDAGNRSMRKHGRTEWDEEDWCAATAEFDRLCPSVTTEAQETQ